ncbi:MAG: hypothetical protein KC736_03980 [Candidatus Moranbacteria bacterium]|nr:hypothetical protein [Candidatus Moranbacteria bacterium]
MREKTSKGGRKMLLKKLVVFALLGFMFLLGGCASMPVPLSKKEVNAEMAGESMKQYKKLRPGMTREDVYALLGISQDTPNIRRMTTSEVGDEL